MILCFPFFGASFFNGYAFKREIFHALLTSLKYSSPWFGDILVESGRCLYGWYIHAIFRSFDFTYCSVAFPMILRIPRDTFPIFLTLSTLYALLGEGGGCCPCWWGCWWCLPFPWIDLIISTPVLFPSPSAWKIVKDTPNHIADNMIG